MRWSAFALGAALSCVVACGGDDRFAFDPDDYDFDAGFGGGSDAGTGGGGGDDNAGGYGPDQLPTDPEIAMPTEGVAGDRLMSDLTTQELEVVCTARERFEQDLSYNFRRYLCLAVAVEGGQVGDDPAFTCDRLRMGCDQLVDLEEEFADMGFGDLGEDSEVPIASCMFDMSQRRRPECVPVTLDAYKACELENLRLMGAVIDRRALTCDEAAPMVTVLPDGIRDCACGVPDRYGPIPANDADWDYVDDAVDVCPGTDTYYVANAVGCSDTQDTDGDGFWDELDLCLGTEPGAAEVSPLGCSRAQDPDFDGVLGVDDACPDTPDGAEIVVAGCSAEQDTDGDAVPNAADWCPGSPDIGTVDHRGCDPAQGEPWAEAYADAPPPDTERYVLGAFQDDPIDLHFVAAAISDKAGESFTYEGPLAMGVGLGRFMIMQQSSLTVELGDAPGEIAAISGTVDFVFPAVGFLEGLRTSPVGTCSFAFAPGAHEQIAAQDLPVDPSRWYIMLGCAETFEAQLGALKFELPGDREVVFVLDPGDPAFFVHVDLDALGPFGRSRDVSLAVSANGTIPYEPLTTREVEDLAQPFAAHAYVGGPLPVPAQLPGPLLKFVADGEAWLDLDPRGDGPPSVTAPDVRFGSNGNIDLRLSFFGSLSISVVLGQGSSGGTFDPDGTTRVWATGTAGPSALRLPTLLPIEPVAESVVAFVASTDPRENRLVLDTRLNFLGSTIPLPLIPDFEDFVIDGRLVMDDEGVRITGSVSGSIHPWLTIRGGALDFEAFFAWDRGEFFVRLTGGMSIDGESAGEIYFGSDEISVDGDPFFFLPF